MVANENYYNILFNLIRYRVLLRMSSARNVTQKTPLVPQQKTLEAAAQQTCVRSIPNQLDKGTDLWSGILLHKLGIHFHRSGFENGNRSLPKDRMELVLELFQDMLARRTFLGRTKLFGNKRTGFSFGGLDGTGNAGVVAQELVVGGDFAENVHNVAIAIAIVIHIDISVIAVKFSIELVGFLFIVNRNKA